MKNQFLIAQIQHMQATATVFQQSCRMAALEDDQRVDKQEEKVLKELASATEKYCAKLEKILEKY